jgi:hypothetical protein
MFDFNFQIVSMSKRTLFNYFSSGSGSGSSSPHANEGTSQPKKPRVEFTHSIITADPGNRKPIDSYESEIRDQLRRAYVLNGPTQPQEFNFPRKWNGGEWRSFQKAWFDEFDWLEYSESKDAAYCLYCYLFFNSAKPEKFGSSVFAHQGYVNWKKAKDNLNKHSNCKTHVEARLSCDAFMNQRTSVVQKIVEVSTDEEKRYEIRLTSSLDVSRFLISQGQPFRGDDESSTSLNKGTFLEMVDWYKDRVEIVKDAYDNGSKNCQMLSPSIQKDLAKACAEEVTAVIMDEIRGRKFSVLIDESRDVSIKEQMAVIIRLVLHNCNFLSIFLQLN